MSVPKQGRPSYKSIYNDIPHKRLEFWHKTTFLQGFDIHSAQIEMNDFYSFGSTYKRWRTSNYSADGGTCSIKFVKSYENKYLLENIKENIEITRANFCVIDCVLRKKITNNILELKMIANVSIKKESDFDILSLLFFSIRLPHTLGTC